VISTGLAWHPPRRDGFKGAKTLVSLQGDWLFTPGDVGQIGARGAFRPEDYRLSRGYAVRGGAEASWPLWGGDRPWVLTMRVGARWEKAVAVEYTGEDPSERLRFAGGEPAWGFSAGASFGLRTLAQGHASLSWRDGDCTVLIGVTVRYPGLFP